MISSSEWEVMRVVWAHNGVTSQEVFQYVNKKNNWKLTTVKTLLSRLVQKGVLTTKKEGKKYIYFANIAESDYDLLVLNDIFNFICNKKKPAIVANLLQNIELDQQAKDDLTQLLANHKVVDDIKCKCSYGQCSCSVNHHKEMI